MPQLKLSILRLNPSISRIQALFKMTNLRARSSTPERDQNLSQANHELFNEHQSKRARLEPEVEDGQKAQPKPENGSTRKDFSALYAPGLYLAPMVRIGTLPTRLLALKYGAELVWGPEIVDKAMIGSERIVDERTGTIHYTKNNGKTSIWQTHPREKSRLVYQIGSADKDLALTAAQTVLQDVSGIDLNCGCPKDFSLKGGMGAALLKEPEKLCGILSHLVQNIPSHPISAKIRLLPSQEDTLELVKKISATGISCLTVHCRTQLMRSTESALLHRLREIVETVKESRANGLPLPVVANGDCFEFKDLEHIKSLTGVERVMIARGAERNVSCFSSDGPADMISQVMPLYIKTGLVTGQGYANAKYCLTTMEIKATPSPTTAQQQPKNNKSIRKEMKTKIQQSKDWETMCALFRVDYLQAKESLILDQVFETNGGS
ncbi:hypothetical protein CROQUDRAFT_649876 [Cronartium quercuum f. sp. fusiforme G11]|uniref:DUS-like FMN-binding domain-containing protein n=1 Tax=Cronartium quercuum f. sp. fusiforme G11 TaxID=708437 RepID=A0A9P6NY40_9BASI|nr:hypothetical protein CROQUDRAFT_649876 [Cronartium quercuum f. sp. fusiforme G11]